MSATRPAAVAAVAARGLRGPPRVDHKKILAAGAQFDRSLFSTTISCKGIRVPARKCNPLCQRLKADLLKLPKTRTVVSATTEQGGEASEEKVPEKIVLLDLKYNEEVLPDKIQDCVREAGGEVVDHEVFVGYDSWSAEDILKAALPADLDEVTTAFETVGHLAHMNLRHEQLPYRFFIGQVILDKNKAIRTVVNKTKNIASEFRVFPMEVIAGDGDTRCEVRENGCRYQFDFAKVYWNSRLHTEHQRLVDLIQPDEVVCDMMAGVGPFALPIAKNGRRVYANDLNPESYAALTQNVVLNRVHNHVQTYNMDGGAVVAHVLDLVDRGEAPNWGPFHHVIMNLPATAIEFLGVFRGLYHSEARRKYPLPMIHCHCFSKGPDYDLDVRQRAEHYLGGALEEETTVHNVRNVSPHKEMMCISFRLPRAVAYADPNTPVTVKRESTDVAAETKKPKVEVV